MRMILVAALAIAPLVAGENEPAKRLNQAASVLTEIMATPDKGIPEDLLEKAHCIVIVPSLKTAAFVVGGKYGRGFESCRKHDGVGWSAPAAIVVEGGSFGFQIGGSETDVVMLVMNDGGMNKLLESKFTLGGEGSVAAGPVGRTATAQTDAQMHAEILSWSRTQGLFAGIALEGATLKGDNDANVDLYGRKLSNREILTKGIRPPEAAERLLALLDKYSVHEHVGPTASIN